MSEGLDQPRPAAGATRSAARTSGGPGARDEPQPEPEAEAEPDRAGARADARTSRPRRTSSRGCAGRSTRPATCSIPDGYGVIEGEPSGNRRAVGIVVARFNGELTGELLAARWTSSSGSAWAARP